MNFSVKSDYGLYSIGFAFLVLNIGVSNALIMLQMTVIAPEKIAEDRKLYFGSMFLALQVLALFMIVSILLSAYFFSPFFAHEYNSLIISTVLAIPGVLTIEFVRQYLYFHSLAIHAFLMDLAFFLLYFSILSSFIYFEFDDIYLWALAINGGIAIIIGFLVILYIIRLPLARSVSSVYSSFSEAARSGYWAVLGVFVTALQAQGYIYLLVFLKSTSAVAEMNVARLFLSPLLVMSNGFSRVIIPKMALLKTEGNISQAIVIAYKVLGFLLLSLVVYMGIILFLWEWIDTFLNKRGYENLKIPVLLWGAFFVTQAVCNTPSELLKIYREFRVITIAVASTAIVIFSISIITIQYYGIIGAIVTLSIGNIGLALLLWSRFKYVRRRV
jgi:O-antigen/teichoic acid export membrane protein